MNIRDSRYGKYQVEEKKIFIDTIIDSEGKPCTVLYNPRTRCYEFEVIKNRGK